MKYLFFAATLLLAFAACKNTTEKVENNGAFRLKYQVNADGKKDGAWARYDSTGKILIEEAFYHLDSLEGAGKFFYPSGKIQELRHFKNNKFEGDFKEYYEDGTLKADYKYANNQIEGEYKKYYPNKQLLEVVLFKNGQEDGPFKEYYANGKPKAEGTYKYDADHDRAAEDGELTKYDSLGTPTKMNCTMGRCITVH